ncbi:glycoside hydrolase family 97 protein [Vallitalea sp.]|jgi:alpha-glucosidase|uniref:glycoside hydrolase family 97 protein n=1 Tax=Vallitalea sp. TaxID=1882829 RepID=UPI0025DD528E|nr:glycoside hydrolase family 97 protein [Vallitalea sp.]MCT4685910.1 glycoside hydrolase family 97 protein [Vallitalea sp.]
MITNNTYLAEYNDISNVQVIIQIIENNIYYQINKNKKIIIKPSKIQIYEKYSMVKPNWKITKIDEEYFEGKWKPVLGKCKEVINKYKEIKIYLEDDNNVQMNLIIRLFNDGMAFRYQWPLQDGITDVYQLEEKVEYIFEDNHMCWYSNDGEDPQTMNRGGELINEFSTGNSPITIKVNENCYVALHEANLKKYNVGRFIGGEAENSFTMISDTTSTLPHYSPWRTINIVEKAEQLVESNMIENLNEPCAIEDTSWIKSGKSYWDWRNHGSKQDGFTYGLNNESMRRYIDGAAKHNVQYLLIDGGWYQNPNVDESDPVAYIEEVDIPNLSKYAENKGVGLWLYLDDRALKLYDMDRTFSIYKKWGIKGIKHGFTKSRGQDRVEFTIKVAKKCADYQLMYVPHEPVRPWGLHVTYPNFVSSEFVNAQFDGPTREAASPTHLCIIPFTNNLAGPLDRSPGMFDLDGAINRDRIRRQPVTTIASQLAQCVIIHTAFLTLADNPNSYMKKADMFEFIKELPEMNWEETKCIKGDIGKYVAIARKSNEQWFVGCQNNEDARSLSLSMDFLEEGVKYIAKIYADGEDAHYLDKRESYKIMTKSITYEDNINVNLAPGGGCAIWIKKEK